MSPPEPTLRRLTSTQWENAVHDVLGKAIVLPAEPEPDEESAGLFAIGASLTTISPRGVEQYEDAAYSIAAQVMDDPDLRTRAVPCTPAATFDEDCAREALTDLGLKLWRRPLTDDEVTAWVDVSGAAASTLGDFHDGLEFGIAGLLQSPNFLFRVELGEPDPDVAGAFRYTDYEMASRLSFFLWNTTPDDELLEAAASGLLTTEEGLGDQVDGMLEDDRAKEGVRAFFTEWWQLWRLESLNKDPLAFVHLSSDVGPSAKEQALLDIEALVFEEDGDYARLLTSRHTHLDRKLAAIYGVPAPTIDGFDEAELPKDGPRAGFLGQVAFLAPNAHPGSSSATLRGKFVREVLLCQEIPPPPSDLNTAIPEASADAPTLRDRVDVHLTVEMCAGCHVAMDPIGLGLEQFDGLGGYRTEENDATIDPSGDLDGKDFEDALELQERITEHDDFGRCAVSRAYEYGNGHVTKGGEVDLVRWHDEGFERKNRKLRDLLADIATGPGFRTAAEVEVQ